LSVRAVPEHLQKVRSIRTCGHSHA
jgi:hypothetical protein